MKPHPRIRKTIKWGGAGLTAWTFGIWLVTLPHEHAVWAWQPFARSSRVFVVPVPFWTPVAAIFLVTVITWRLVALAGRRAKLNLCPKCNYDRAGIAAGSACPECGAVPVSI